MSVPSLFVLSPGTLEPRDLPEFRTAARALAGGSAVLLLRERGLADGDYLRLARDLATELPLYLHDRPHLVTASGARGVHLGFRSLEPAAVRAFGDFTIGLSTHASDDPKHWEATDYVFHGPVHETPSKRGWIEPIGAQGLTRACQESTRPVIALGGLQPEHVANCLEAGVHGVAVLGGVWGSDWRLSTPRERVWGYEDALASRRP